MGETIAVSTMALIPSQTFSILERIDVGETKYGDTKQIGGY